MAQKTVKITGKKVTTLGDAGRLYVMVAGIGRTFIAKEHGLKEGETLSGTIVCEEVTYETNADGTKRDTPLVRWEVTDFTSFAATNEVLGVEMEQALIAAKVKAIAKIEFKASDFFNNAPVVAEMAQA